MRPEVSIREYKFSLGRALILGLLGLALGLFTYFDSISLSRYFLKVGSLVALLAFAGFASNNLGSKKSIAVLAVLIIPNIYLQFTVIDCPSVGWPWMDAKHNTLTDEVMVKTYDGGGPGCVNYPWYIEDVSEERERQEIVRYCKQNNSSEHCQMFCTYANNTVKCQS